MKGNTVFVTLASTDMVILKVHKIIKEGNQSCHLNTDDVLEPLSEQLLLLSLNFWFIC